MKGDTILFAGVDAYTVPTDASEADGTYDWASTTIIIVTLRTGAEEGIGYTYAAPAVSRLIRDVLLPLVQNGDPFDIPFLREKMLRAIRNNGRPGISSMAIAAVDNALWDLKAKLAGLPLVSLLGRARAGIPVYGSGGFTTYSAEQMEKQFSGWADQGIKMFKMKIGRSLPEDKKRIRDARKMIGQDAELFVDANGAYTVKEALELYHYALDYNVAWFEEPVVSDNLEGLAFIRERASLDVAAGEYGYDPVYFKRMLETGAVDVLQVDATRCGGISGFLEAAALSAGFMIPVSAHTAPAIHIAPCCSAGTLRHLEYFHDHVRIEEIFFEGISNPVNGILYPDLSKNGMGIVLKKKDIEKYKIDF